MPDGTQHDDVVQKSEDYLAGVLQDTGVPVLKDSDVPPALRLHLITSVAHLGRISKDTLHARQDRSATEERSW
ncbi:MAG: hypothetical protein WDA16_06310 [Candidatus Thermoplasmatota archaeon]